MCPFYVVTNTESSQHPSEGHYSLNSKNQIIVYSANHSHASYPYAGKIVRNNLPDDHTADGPVWDCRANLVLLSREKYPWIQYSGRWGKDIYWFLQGEMHDRLIQEQEAKELEARIAVMMAGREQVFDSAILFDVGKADLKRGTKDNLTKFSDILKECPDRNLVIEGHTDSTGSDEYNMNLSKQRAQSVSDFLSGLGVSSGCFTVVGYGESKPIASNDTIEGRRLNRRVEIKVNGVLPSVYFRLLFEKLIGVPIWG